MNASPKPVPPKPKAISKDTAKMQQDIRNLTNALLDDANSVPEVVEEVKAVVVDKPIVRKPPFVQKPHLTDHPFRNNEGLQLLKKSMGSK